MTSVVVLIRLWSVRPAASSPPPVAHASGSHTLTLPNNSLVLRGSVSDGDQSRVHFLWTRDPQSPAAGVSGAEQNMRHLGRNRNSEEQRLLYSQDGYPSFRRNGEVLL